MRHRTFTRETFDSPVAIENGTVIGCIGMSYDKGEDGYWSEKPQEDDVVIEADVHIGPNCTIHRGGWRSTLIKSGCRIGAQSNIGHNVILGNNVLVAPHVSIAGSCTIGDNVTIWQGAMIAQHIEIGYGAVIGMGAVVLNDVPPGATVVGNPAKVAKIGIEKDLDLGDFSGNIGEGYVGC
jgi:UDP-3-O-[3-hydroxymyristoyl] glucosamine N-acyltransferase